MSAAAQRRRLAIIGGGSSGLVSLKFALEWLPDWEVVCFEKTGGITGCWGNPYPGFVSTSTKYTTQFASFPLFDAGVSPDGGASRDEFFRDGEYGEYLERFAEHFALRPHIRLHCRVTRMVRGDGDWELSIVDDSGRATTERFDRVILCTGLAARARAVPSEVETLPASQLRSPGGLEQIAGRRVVVIGGGESAVDFASRLARPELGNEVFLSLRSGVRVSPRYHPIRGVPSDFLRNRLMLSIHEDLRNWIGQRFVELRIRYRETFERVFPGSHAAATRGAPPAAPSADADARAKRWAYALTRAAKDDLFNMFHNKSDDFLIAVGEQRIEIVGGPVDESCRTFFAFDSQARIDVSPDLIVPAIGYESALETLSGGEFALADFFLGCCHVRHADLFLVGFARPIIGNVPTISEMQARFVCGQIAGRYARPANIDRRHAADIAARRRRYKKLNLDAVYPVEMFPYCDRLARLMGAYPTARSAGSWSAWLRMQLAPATTMHYFRDAAGAREPCDEAPIHMPATLIALLYGLRPLSALYRLASAIR